MTNNHQDFIVTIDGTLARYVGPGGDVSIPDDATKIG